MTDHLDTERLLLRRWRDEDRAPFAALNADPVVMEHFPARLAREESDAMVERIEAEFAAEGFGLWAVEERASGAFLGFVGLHRVPQELAFAPAVEIGWRLARTGWGQGYATEAARAALDDARSRLGLREVVSFTALTNARSIAVMERIGMVRDAEFEHPGVAEGSPVRRHVLYRASLG